MTKKQSEIQNPKSKIVWFLFALVIIFSYFFGLTIPLLGPDEPRYAQVAREMFERGDWVTPTLGGFDWFEKPVLLYWLQIASYKIFGVSEFAARFGSALFGLGTILSLWILGKNYPQIYTDEHGFEEQNPKSKIKNPKSDFADWLVLISASSIGLIAFSRGASFDIILTFPMTAALCCYFLFETFLQKHYFSEAANHILIPIPKSKIISATSPLVFAYLFLVGFYFFIGIALLAKGLIGIIFPFAIVFFYHILKFELLPSTKFLVSLLWGILLSLIVASAWYLPMYQANGWKFIDEFFIQHHFQRYTSNKYQHPQPFWFFFAVLPLMTIPWLPFFFASIWNLFPRQFAKPQIRKFANFSASPLLLFSISWMLVPLVFFSLSGSKLPGYILPALPAALILTTIYIYDFVRKSVKRKIFVKITAVATFAVIAVILQFFMMNYAESETVKNLVAAANAQGYANQKIVNLYVVSHNLEFYAAGRLLRETDGKQKRFDDFAVLISEMKREDLPEVLILVANKDIKNVTENGSVEAKILGDNGESSIIAIRILNFSSPN